MSVPKKSFDEIRKKMGDKSAKEYVLASERPITYSKPGALAKAKALDKKMKNPNPKKYSVAHVKNPFDKESIVLKNKKTGGHGTYFP